MKKLFKIGLLLSVLFCVFLVVASIALKAYLSDARLRSMIVPPIEKVLGRTVEIGQINVSLFTGVQVYDFAIKEANGSDDFVSSSRFVISYNLFPLIQGKFVVSEIRFVDPSIQVLRDKDGVFNFQSLVVLTKKKKLAEKEGSMPTAGATDQSPLPVSIEIKNFVIENGMVAVRDDLGVLPATKVITNSEINLGVNSDLTYYYNGEIRFIIDTLYKGVELHNEGRIGFDETRCDYMADVVVDEQSLQVRGSVENYKAQYPPLIFNLYSDELDVDRLLQSVANLGQKADGKSPSSAQATKKKGVGSTAVPSELNVHGEMLLGRVKVKGLLVEDFKVQFGLEQSILSVTDLNCRTLGGEARGEVSVNLKGEQPSYEGKVAGHEFQLDAIQKTYIAKSPANMMGGVSGVLSFKGQGTDPEVIKKRLSGTGEYTLTDGMISGSDITRSLAAVLNMKELKDVPIKKMAGRFEIKKGKILFNVSTDSVYFQANSKGTLSLNGGLHVPVTMSFSPQLSQKMDRRLEVARYMEKENGRTIVHFLVDGTVSKPGVTLDVRKTGKKAASQVIDELLKDGSEEEKAAGEAVKSVLEELFGH